MIGLLTTPVVIRVASRTGTMNRWSLLPCVTVLLPSCTVIGIGGGLLVDADIPGPYQFQPFQCPSGSDPSATLSGRYALAKGDRIELKLANGNTLSGRYAGVVGPSATDPESHVLVESEPGHRRDPVSVTSVATSQIREVGVEVTGYGWAKGMLIGLVVDVAFIAWVSSTLDLNVQ